MFLFWLCHIWVYVSRGKQLTDTHMKPNSHFLIPQGYWPTNATFWDQVKNWVTDVLMYLSWLNLTMLHLDLCFFENLGCRHTFVILCPFTELARLPLGLKRGHKATTYLYNLVLYYAFIILGCIWLWMHVDNLVPSIMIHKVMITCM